MKPLTPKQIVRKYNGATHGLFGIDEVVFLIKAYHKQFEQKKDLEPFTKEQILERFKARETIPYTR